MICFSHIERESLNKYNINMDNNLLEKYNNASILASTEDQEILGLCFYEIEGAICKIKNVQMFNDSLLIKDGLIRSLINFVDIKGAQYMVVKNEGEESFYCRIGFNHLFFRHFMIDLNGEESNYLFLDIKDFFEKGCCSSKK